MRLRVGLAQLTSTDNISANLQTIEKLYLQAAAEQADLAAFPENSLSFRVRRGEPIVGVRADGPEFKHLRQLVDRHGTSLMVTTSLVANGSKLHNSTYLFESGRAPESLYTKIHLFDVDVPGAPSVRESDHYDGGKAPHLLDFKGWKIGLSICFDLRFADLYLNYARQKVDLILIPSSFLVPTGEAHWHVLLRARAIESQCYVLAPAQSGDHRSGDQIRHTYGHSLAIDPWGRVLCDLEGSPEIRVVELNQEQIAKVRGQIPMLR